MIAQDIGRTGDFPKKWRIDAYGRLRKIPCAGKRQARARVIYETSGLPAATMRHGMARPTAAPRRTALSPAIVAASAGRSVAGRREQTQRVGNPSHYPVRAQSGGAEGR